MHCWRIDHYDPDKLYDSDNNDDDWTGNLNKQTYMADGRKYRVSRTQ